MLKYRYFLVLTDFYGQPNGDVEELYLTEEEAQEQRGAGHLIFREYSTALYLAQA